MILFFFRQQTNLMNTEDILGDSELSVSFETLYSDFFYFFYLLLKHLHKDLKNVFMLSLWHKEHGEPLMKDNIQSINVH